MSCIVLSDLHLSTILRFGFGPSWADEDFRPRLQATADQLRRENILAYNERYEEEDPVLPCEIDYSAPEVTPVEALRLMSTYDECCEELGTYHGDTAAEHIRAFRVVAFLGLDGWREARCQI
jgi:hypothetical protein